jgi:hypothetical protein
MPAKKKVIMTFEDMISDGTGSGNIKGARVTPFTMHTVSKGDRVILATIVFPDKNPGADLTPELELKRATQIVPITDVLEVCICGHGNIGIDYIANNANNAKISVKDLARILVAGLGARANSKQTASLTRINMLSCLFGRSVDRSYEKSPAGKLHQALMDKRVYVELIARTEMVVSDQNQGQLTAALVKSTFEDFGGAMKKSQPYSKVRWYYDVNGDPKIGIADYERYASGSIVSRRHLIDVSTIEGQQIIWAEYVITELIKEKSIHTAGTQVIGEETVKRIDPSDTRGSALYNIIVQYEMHDWTPQQLRDALQLLVTSDSLDPTKNFTIHMGRHAPSRDPARARKITSLLSKYPGQR